MKNLIIIFLICCTIDTYSQEISKIEYSIDQFVAEGNGTSVNVSSISSLDSVIDINISGLNEGLHTIYFRSQNSDGKWSMPLQSSFYISNPDVCAVEKVFYKFFNESYSGEWNESLVVPTRKNVDSLFSVSTTGLDMDEKYSIEFYAVNTCGKRGFSTYLNSIDFISNNTPVSLVSELDIDVISGTIVQISMDTLFGDNDIAFGDSLVFSLIDISEESLQEFTSWPSNNVIEFAPVSNHIQTYTFNISATDLAGENTIVAITLNVVSPTGIKRKVLTDIEIYPNPARDKLQIKNLNYSGEVVAQILNPQGVIIAEQIVRSSNIDISNLSSGIYIIKLSSKDDIVTKPFIKE